MTVQMAMEMKHNPMVLGSPRMPVENVAQCGLVWYFFGAQKHFFIDLWHTVCG